jgi:hypothetical protein
MNTSSLYRRVMGAQFASLPAAVQRFHALTGTHVLEGWVDVEAPDSLAAAWLARALGSPRSAHSGALRFELHAGPAMETWTRHFPARTMHSRMTSSGSRLVEHLGWTRLVFDLVHAGDKLQMQLVSLRFLGIAAPSWLRPRVVAEESGDGSRLHFRVRAVLPVIGVVAGYTGYLELPGGESR